MKKCLSVILGIILTACLVACGSSNKGTLKDSEQAIISNQEVSDTEEQETSADNQQTDLDADYEQENEEKVAVVYFQEQEIQEKLQIYWRRKLTLTF